MSFREQIHKLGALILSAFTLISASGCQSGSSETSVATESSFTPIAVTGEVTITSFNVTKADAFVIQTANSVTVIDAGLKGDGKKIEKFLSDQGIDTINNFIITHFDKDHVGGAARVVNRMNVENIFVPDYTSESEEYTSFIEKVNEKGYTPKVMNTGSIYSWVADDANFRIYAANETYYGKNEENDFSLVLYMEHGDNSFLFTGDAEEARQKEIMKLGLSDVTFLKYPYHGNYLSTTEDFLDMFSPDVAIICCSEVEDADPSLYETMEKRGIEAYYMQNGDVTIVSDGTKLTCTQG